MKFNINIVSRFSFTNRRVNYVYLAEVPTLKKYDLPFQYTYYNFFLHHRKYHLIVQQGNYKLMGNILFILTNFTSPFMSICSKSEFIFYVQTSSLWGTWFVKDEKNGLLTRAHSPAAFGTQCTKLGIESSTKYH